MSHNHETVSKQKHPTSKLVRICDAVAIAFYIIIVGGFTSTSAATSACNTTTTKSLLFFACRMLFGLRRR